MMTFKQAIQNLGRHPRHVASIGLTSLGLAAALSGPVSAQTHHSGERSDDFTGMPRNMTPLPSNDRCSTGQIAVGSTCVDVPTYTPPRVSPWTALVPTETRCGIVNDGARISYTGSTIRRAGDGRNFCIMMNTDGAGSVSGYNWNDILNGDGTTNIPIPDSDGTGAWVINRNSAIYTTILAYVYGSLVLKPTLSGSSVSGWTIGIYELPQDPNTGNSN